jgi:hypothetical protein
MVMMNRVILGVALLAGVAGCSTTEFKSTWKDPSARAGQLQGKTVGAFVVTRDQSLRRAGEDALANELNQRGVHGIPGYRLVDASQLTNPKMVRSSLRQAGADAAVVMRVVDTRQEVNYVPGSSPYYGSFGGYWNYGWGTTGYVTTDTVVRVETVIYSVSEDKLLWGGISETVDPRKLDSFIKEVADEATKEMRKQGLTTK